MLDDIPNNKIAKFKKDWFIHLNANLKALADNLNDGSALSDEDNAELKASLEAFKKTI